MLEYGALSGVTLLENEAQIGGNLHHKLSTSLRPIENKYREGKLKSTSEGELKDLKSARGKRILIASGGFVLCQRHVRDMFLSVASVYDPS